MDVIHKKGSYSLDERRFPEGESENERYTCFPHNDHLTNDQDKIINEENGERRRRKRRKKKVKIMDEMNEDEESPSPTRNHHSTGDRNMDGSIPMNDLKSRETPERNHKAICDSSLQQAMESVEFSPITTTTTANANDVRHLALQQAINRSKSHSMDKKRHTDYVLVHKTGDHNHSNSKLREIFEAVLEEEGLKIDRKYTTMHSFVILHCPFERLCIEAEYVSLEMPLAGYIVPEAGTRSWLSKLGDKFKTDDTVDYISAPFCVSKSNIYEGIKNPDYFFRPALRSLLVNHILTNIDIRDKESRLLGQNPQGLPYLLLEGAYSDAFIVHEKSMKDKKFPLSDDGDEEEMVFYGQDIIDPRSKLHQTWLKWFKFQPLWKVRNYFGEKIALYFAWLGSLTFSLIVPMLFGLAVFLWGLTVAIYDNPISNQTNSTVSNIISKWAKNAFDNAATPYFALVICLWGTIFLEIWKRLNARLAYQWDVDNFEEQEPNRPEFYGTEIRPDPVTGQDEPFYPFKLRTFKMCGSFSLLLFMVCLVLASLFAVIVYRIIARKDFFVDRGALGPTIASITSTFLNTCSIMIMGKVYQALAVKLTDWENHRTQTLYEDALIIKLFGFQFVNSYTSLFYIAFFRRDTASNGILGFGSKYNDACGENNDCMTLLSLQVAMLMIMKPLPKLLTDVILPGLKRAWRNSCNRNRVEVADEINPTFEDYLDYELHKEPLADFTLSEYTEKVLQYGFLMLFAAAFPLAPLIALLSNLIDMKMDARRLLWVNRRPIAHRAQDIGMWYGILEFLNIVGVVTNGFLVTFTSSYGKNWEGYTNSTITNHTSINPVTNATMVNGYVIVQHPVFSRLWLLIGFEHIVFAFKFLIAWLIPDVPSDVRTAQRREKHHIADILDKAGMRKGPGNRLTESTSSHRRLAASKSSPGRIHFNQTEDTTSNTQNELSTINDKGREVEHNSSPLATPLQENHHNYNRVHLEPLPSSYHPKLGELSKRQIDKIV